MKILQGAVPGWVSQRWATNGTRAIFGSYCRLTISLERKIKSQRKCVRDSVMTCTLQWSLLVALVVPIWGADRTDWSNVRSIPPGTKIGVIKSDLKRVEGELTTVTDSAITLRADQSRTINRDSVVRVYRRSTVNRKKRILIGAAI